MLIDDLPATVMGGVAADLPLLGDDQPVPPLLYADDLALLATSATGLQAQLDQLEAYAANWGLTINANKTKVMVVGNKRSSRAAAAAATTFTCGTAVLEVVEEFCYLGMAMHARQGFSALLARLQEAAAHWSQHRLSYIGRAHVAKQVLAAILVYFVSFVLIPPHIWHCIRGVIGTFLAGAPVAGGGLDGRLRHPSQRVASLPWQEGGIALVDVETHAACLRAKVIARLLQPHRHPWKVLMTANLRAATPTLGPALAVSSLLATRVPNLPPRLAAYVRGFQRTLPHRLKLPAKLSQHQIGAETLFYNRQIQHQGSPLRPAAHQGLVGAGILSVRDLYAAL